MFYIFIALFLVIKVFPVLKEYFNNKSIPKNFIKTKGKIVYFEERISWDKKTYDDSSDFSSTLTDTVSPRYYKPIIIYYYNDNKFEYTPDFHFVVKTPDFNQVFFIYFDPKNPQNAKHKLIISSTNK